MTWCLPVFGLLLALPGSVTAEELRIGVASNFSATAEVLAREFESRTGHRLLLISASTGKLYAQILHGARLDAFLAADSSRPKRLEEQGLAIAGSRFTYARGRLALWSATDGVVDSGPEVLEHGGFRRLAIANPRLAPYGRAARESLIQLGLWERLERLLVRGENIDQTFQFVATGNAELGLVAYSQVTGHPNREAGLLWLVPELLHAPIEQQAVLLREGDALREFFRFLRGAEAAEMMRSHGYDVPVGEAVASSGVGG